MSWLTCFRDSKASESEESVSEVSSWSSSLPVASGRMGGLYFVDSVLIFLLEVLDLSPEEEEDSDDDEFEVETLRLFLLRLLPSRV